MESFQRNAQNAGEAHQRMISEIDRHLYQSELRSTIPTRTISDHGTSRSWQTHSSHEQSYSYSGNTLSRHERDGERSISVHGPVVGRKWQIDRITIGDGENSETYKSIESVPTKYQQGVTALVRRGIPWGFTANPQDSWNYWPFTGEMAKPKGWNCLGGPRLDVSHNPHFGPLENGTKS